METVAINSNGVSVAPNGSIGFRWGEKAPELEQRDGLPVQKPNCSSASLGSRRDEIVDVGFPVFRRRSVQSTLIMWR